MKEKKFAIWRSALSMVLVLCMILGVCPVKAQAAENTLKYVSMGDSMTNGYGLEGYDMYGDVNGYLTVVPEAYPAQFSAWLEEYTGRPVELTQLAISRMRSQDACYLLTYGSEKQFPEDDYIRNWLHKFAEDEDMENIYPGASGIGTMAKKYQDSVKAADLISISLGNNDFGTFLTNRFCYEISQIGFDLGGVSAYDEVDLENLLSSVDPELAKTGAAMYDKLMKMMIGELENAGVNSVATHFAESMVDVAVYTYIGFLLAYRGVMEYIAENNPDAQILIVTLPNHMRGMQIALPGENGENVVLDMDAFYGVLIDSANFYVSALPAMLAAEGKGTNKVFYATPKNEGLMIEELAKGNYKEYPAMREKMVEDLPDFVFDIIDPEGETFTDEITLKDVQNFENLMSGENVMGSLGDMFLNSNMKKSLASCAAYLGLEKAAIRAAAEGTLDADTFAALLDTDEMDAIFNNVLTKYNALIAEAVAENSSPLPGMNLLVQLRATPDALAEALDDPTINALLHLVSRFLVGEAIGCHASNSGYDTVTEAMAEAYSAGYTADDALETTMKPLIDLLEKYGPAVGDILNDATTARYVLRENSYYVALGDGSAAASGYPEKLAEVLGIKHKNLAAELATAEEQLELIRTNAAHIERADLITVGFSNVTFINAAISSILGGEVEVDWTKYVSEADAAKIKQAIADITLKMAGISNEAVNKAMEIFAYSCVVYACELPELVNEIHRINPDAVVIIVGMYNPLDGVIFDLSAVVPEMTLDVGSYLDYLVDAAALHAMAYCTATGNAVYVDGRDVKTCNEAPVLGAMELLQMIGNQCSILNPSEEGDAYLANRLLNALILAEPVSVDRVYGATRFKTSLAIAEELRMAMGVEKFPAVILAAPHDFADALSGSYLAKVKGAPILLIDKASQKIVTEYVQDHLEENGTIYILGGNAAVPAFIETEMTNLTTPEKVVRLKGVNRYETNLKILMEANAAGNDLLISSGVGYADSLSASSSGKPILLVGKSLTEQQKAYLETADYGEIIILGGTGAVSEALEKTLEGYDPDEKVERVKGTTRYETSVKIAERFFGTEPANVILTYGENFPDGLCGGPLAAALGAPVVLTKNENLTKADDYVENAEYGVVLGGSALISDDAAIEIFDMDPSDMIQEKYTK